MKKFLALLMSALMLVSCMAVTSFAQNVQLPEPVIEQLPVGMEVEAFNLDNLSAKTKYVLDYGMKLSTTDTVADIETAPYRNWSVDFEIEFSHDINAVLVGNYGDYDWIALEGTGFGLDFADGYSFKAGETVRVMQKAGELLNVPNADFSRISYNYIVDTVKTFMCGVVLPEDAPADLEINLNLCMYEYDSALQQETGVRYELETSDFDKSTGKITLDFEDVTADGAEGEKVYNINLKSDYYTLINRLNSADLTFTHNVDKGNVAYEIVDIADDNIVVNNVSDDRYEFHFEDKDDNVTNDTAETITIAQVKFTGYGQFDFAVDSNVDTNVVHATTVSDNIVDTFIPGGSLLVDPTNEFDISDSDITDTVIDVPTRKLTMNIDFNNSVEKNVADYQSMKVAVSGGDLDKALVINLGDGVAQNTQLTYDDRTNASYVVDGSEDNKYEIVIDKLLRANTTYNVVVSGDGYRTAYYTVTMTDNKTLNFWNNVMDENKAVEVNDVTKAEKGETKINFLAGDIVKDNNINIYDLSAVVSYFATTNSRTAYSDFVKYDLNRDGVIDSKDVAYVLVSWNN